MESNNKPEIDPFDLSDSDIEDNPSIVIDDDDDDESINIEI